MTTNRADGRRGEQHRALEIEHGPLHRADGSARLTQGKTIVMSSVNGPGDVDGRREIVERATVTVTVTPLSGGIGGGGGGIIQQDGQTTTTTMTERENIERNIRGIIEHCVLTKLHPRTLISVTSQVMSDDGSLLSVIGNSVIASLVEAAVPMTTLVTCSTCAIVDVGATTTTMTTSATTTTTTPVILIDPTASEQAGARAVVTFAMDTEGGIVMCHTRGVLTADEFLGAAKSCKLACDAISRFIRVAITSQYDSSSVVTSTESDSV